MNKSKLGKREKCPIHDSHFCCGRSKPVAKIAPSPRRFAAVERIEDPHHPRGYREKCSDLEMRRRKAWKIKDQNGMCAICHKPLTDYGFSDLDHIENKKMGGGEHDDHYDNLQVIHRQPCHEIKTGIPVWSRKES